MFTNTTYIFVHIYSKSLVSGSRTGTCASGCGSVLICSSLNPACRPRFESNGVEPTMIQWVYVTPHPVLREARELKCSDWRERNVPCDWSWWVIGRALPMSDPVWEYELGKKGSAYPLKFCSAIVWYNETRALSVVDVCLLNWVH